MLQSFLPYRGSVILYGRASQYQHPLAFDLAAAAAFAGAAALYLCDDAHEADAISESAIAWRRARRVPEGHRLRLSGIAARDVLHDPKKLAERIAATVKQPRLLVRDLSLRMAPLDPADPWLPIAGNLAQSFDCPVLTVAHVGALGQFDLRGIGDVEVWHCATFHDKARQSALNVRLQRQKPLSADVIDLHGQEHGRIVIFDRADEPLANEAGVETAENPFEEAADAE